MRRKFYNQLEKIIKVRTKASDIMELYKRYYDYENEVIKYVNKKLGNNND